MPYEIYSPHINLEKVTYDKVFQTIFKKIKSHNNDPIYRLNLADVSNKKKTFMIFKLLNNY